MRGPAAWTDHHVTNHHAAPLSTPAADAAALERVVFEVKRVIVGQDRLVERMLVGLLPRATC